MKNKDFRAQRREEKRRKFAQKQQQRERDRARLAAERQKKTAEKREQTADQMPEQFVGRMEYSRRGGMVFVDSKWLKDSIIVPRDKMMGAQEGEKVVVRITRKARGNKMAEGEVLDVLGPDGNNDTEMHAILAEYGLPYSYPKVVEEAAEAIPEEISRSEIKRRHDMRDVLTFTIDPRDAKDFDDALSYRKNEDGTIEVGVHIADVTHYVRPGSIIDQEGYDRATSVYLVDRTIPMLPERLSNGICSLRPNEDKLTFSVVFTLDSEAQVKHYEIERTVIRSNFRLCYEEAQAIILQKDEPEAIAEERKGLAEALWALDGLAKQLRKRRFEKGAIAFDREEVKFEIDENGKPLSVYFRTSEDANKLIEEFMLLANRTVATHVGKLLKKPFVYRIHDLPDQDKLLDFSQFIRRFGYTLKTGSTRKETVSKNINKLLTQVQGKPEANLIETIAVRAMAKAVYSTENIGHYGLAFPYYTHFTSPIRRYPDMMVHRLLERYLDGGQSVQADEYEGYCKHCSAREQLAANAERASVKYKQVEFMQEHIGQEFDGVISGITDWGVYVELNESKCEGMIPIRELEPADYYDFIEKEYCVKGERTGTIYTLGDQVRVRVTRADLARKQLDFELVR